jgi:hypothetical protein
VAQPNPESATAPKDTPAQVPVRRPDIAALVVLGLIVSLTVRGHFVKPHTDFFQFRETGQALLHGHLPASFKRAPLYPVLVAAAGSLLGLIHAFEVPDQLAAQWINALLLPLNAVLMYLVGRRWFGPGARWFAAWLLLVPWGTYCTAHTIAEPLLICMILLTVYAAQRGSWVAYVAACLASLARYDAAGAIIGLVVADLVRGRGVRRVALSAALAGLPLAIWLVLTAATWHDPGRSYDHYLLQIYEQPRFDLLWSLGVPLEVLFNPDRIRLPGWLPDWEQALRFGVRALLVALALIGVAARVWRKDRAIITVLATYVCYTLVHAVFFYHQPRFGYPLAPLLLLAAGIGVHTLWTGFARIRFYAELRGVLLAFAAVAVACTVIGEAGALPAERGVHTAWGTSLTLLAVGGLILLWAAPLALNVAGLGRLVLLFAMIALAHLQFRVTVPLLGTGREMINMVQAARWVRDFTTPEQRVLAATPGLLRLYAGDEPRGRFLGFHQIEAETWPEILEECRRRGIVYIIWHDRLFEEHGGYYSGKWGLERFMALSEPREAGGVEIEREFAKYPNLWILRVLPAE